MKYIFPFIIIFASHFCISQDGESSKTSKQIKIVPTLSINNDFNLQDYMVGFSGGIEDLGFEWGARVGFNLRPFYKKVQIKSDNNIIRQYREQKYLISLDLDKRFLHFDVLGCKLQLFAGVRTGLLLGNYKGTKNDAEKFFVAAPLGGFCLNFNDVGYLKLGYMQFNDHLTNVSDSKIILTGIINL
jgi:hypothetical protein